MTTVVSGYLPVWAFKDSNTGAALVGGKLFFYQAGTTIKQSVYTDSTGTTPVPNPCILNARGETANSAGASIGIWMPPGTAYKIVLAPSTDSDPPTNPIWSVDNLIAPVGSLTGLVTDSSLAPTSVIYAIDQTFMRSATEITAGVTPTNYGYPYGDLRRYGADPSGATDSTTAIQNAFNSNVLVYGGGPQCTYKYSGNIALPKDIIFDGQGCVMRPSVAGQLYRNIGAPDATTNVTLALKGTLFVTVASTASLAVGQTICIQGSIGLPFFWAQIKQITGLILTLDRPLPFDYISNTNSTGNFNWQATTAYVYGDFVTNGGNIYFCAIPGTSAGAGGPTGTTPNVGISDGGVAWIYWGTISCNLYNNSTTLWQRCWFRNVDWDGSLYTTPGSLGMCIRACIYRSVLMENMRFFNFNVNGANQPDLLGIFYGIDCKVRSCVFEENIGNTVGGSPGANIDIQGFRSATLENNSIMGAFFGCDMTYCEAAVANGNILNGTKAWEIFQGAAVFPTPPSQRGIKMQRCMGATFTGNDSQGYQSPLRGTECFRATWTGNNLRNCDPMSTVTFTGNVAGLTTGTLSVGVPNGTYNTTFSDGETRSVTVTTNTTCNWAGALSAGTITTAWMQGTFTNTTGLAIDGASAYWPLQREFVITGNRLENCGGHGIAFNSGVGVYSGRNICANNQIIGCNGAGIYSSDRDNIIEGNRIENWDRSATGWGAIHLTAVSHQIVNNRFLNSDNTRYCLNTLPTGGGVYPYTIIGNVVEYPCTCPLIQGGYDVVKTGATTIASGATSQTITPNLISSSYTMDATMVYLTPGTKTPTNTPRMVSAGAFAANSFAIQCDSDPGASGLAVYYRASVPQPFKL